MLCITDAINSHTLSVDRSGLSENRELNDTIRYDTIEEINVDSKGTVYTNPHLGSSSHFFSVYNVTLFYD